jgi:hypothetical protein
VTPPSGVRYSGGVTSRSKKKTGTSRRGFAETDVDALVADREDDLNASIKRARTEVKQGLHSGRSVKQIAADGAKRLRQEQRRKTR